MIQDSRKEKNMARSFEEIDVWKKARELVNFIYRFKK